MLGVIIGFVAILLGVGALLRKSGARSGGNRLLRVLRSKALGVFFIIVGCFLLLSTSFILVDANGVGHLKRIYAFKELPSGRIIALDGEKGPQAQILGPGFHFIPLVRVLYDFEEWDVVHHP